MYKTAQIPPHNKDAELAYIGCVLLDNTVLNKFKVDPLDFYDNTHQKIMGIFYDMNSRNIDIDMLTFLDKDNTIDTGYLIKAVQQTLTASNAHEYAKIIKDKARRRRLIAQFETYIQDSFNDIDVDLNIFQKHKRHDGDRHLAEYDGDDRIVLSSELAGELADTKESVFKIQTQIPSMDRLLDGVEAGELIIVTGPTGEGKTTLLMSITQNIANSNLKSCWFTLEVTPRQFLDKLSIMSGTLPLFYLPRENTENYITWIEERIIEAKQKFGVHAVFIDHIHQIFSLQRISKNVSLEIGDLVAKIKDIAIKQNVVIFLIAHSKDPMLPTSEPRKEDIRDSGLISRLADTIIGVWRTNNDDNGQMMKRPAQLNEDDNRSKVRVFKNRRTGTLGGFVMTHKNHYLSEFDGFVTEAPKKKVEGVTF